MTAGILSSPPASTSLLAEFISSSVFSARQHTADRDASSTRVIPHDAEYATAINAVSYIPIVHLHAGAGEGGGAAEAFPPTISPAAASPSS